MKRTALVLALALVLTLAFSASAFATTGKFFAGGVDYYRWTMPTGSPSPGTAFVKSAVSALGDNGTNPGAHANYLATTAKCGMCHSVHRAAGGGTNLLPTANATCSGCHVGGTAITGKIITWADVDLDWVPETPVWDPTASSGAGAWVYPNAAAAGGGGGPHNDPVWDTVYEAGDPAAGWTLHTYPDPSYELFPFSRYGCATRRCHATNPHGANSSKYKMFSAKLLFNNTPAQDSLEYPELVHEGKVATYGGDDAVWNAFGATDAAVERFVKNNASIVQTTAAGDILIKKTGEAAFRNPTTAETHALVSGLTCGRPSNPGTGEDECHAEASYAIVDRGIKENRNHATGISGNDGTGPAPLNADGTINKNAYRTDNTGAEYNSAGTWYSGGNGNRDSKTGHIAGSFASGSFAYAPIAGCTSCHDQTDAANTVAGNFTFPHGQTATGATNLQLPNGASATGTRVRIWAGYAGSTVGQLITGFGSDPTKWSSYSNQKAFDGQCLKCHRDGTGSGVGLTF